MRSRRNDVCDQRRRRVLIEENLGAADLKAPVSPEAGSTFQAAHSLLPSYTDAALADQRSPITAVIPRRRWTLIVLLLSGLAAIAGVEAAYGKLHLLPRELWASGFAAADVQAAGGLAAWFCSLMLAVAAFQGLQIYRLRRHKTDDYRGRYRVWLWMPLVLFFMATSVATHIHHDLANLVSRLANVTSPAESASLWPLIYCALWVLVGLRLAFEVRQSRGSLAALVLATCCYLTVAFATLYAQRAVGVMGEMPCAMATTAIAMSGHLATFLTMAIYGRHVYLDSQGMLSARATEAKRRKTGKTPAGGSHRDAASPVSKRSPREQTRPNGHGVPATSDDSNNSKPSRPPAKNEPAQAEDRKSTAATSPRPMVGSGSQLSRAPDETSGGRKLSKAERRRLRKQKRREQRRKAA